MFRDHFQNRFLLIEGFSDRRLYFFFGVGMGPRNKMETIETSLRAYECAYGILSSAMIFSGKFRRGATLLDKSVFFRGAEDFLYGSGKGLR